MKKIRILALLLALLMIPFGMLFACNDDEDTDPDDEEPEEEGGDNEEEGGNGTTLVGNKTVNDGTKLGYLAFFSFDNADNGNLGVIAAPASSTDPNSDVKPIEPYFTYFRGTIVPGGAYTVKTLAGTDKYLSVQRTGGKVSSPVLDFNIGAPLKQDLEGTHIIQFDMDFSKGLFSSPVTFAGVKESVTQTFFTIEDNVMYDCNGAAIYGEKDTDKEGWISVAVVIDDNNRAYDIYIDMVKQTNGIPYSNTAYKSWNQEPLTGYRFSIAATNANDVYLRLDDVSVRNGKEKDLGTLAGTDFVVKYYDKGAFKYSYLQPTRDGVAKFIATQAGIKDLKTEMFGAGALAFERVTLSKVNTVTGEITDVYHDYGALKGDYSEILTFKSGNAEIKITTYNGCITYDADTTDTTDAISGTYAYADGVLTFNWGENAAPQIEGADIVAGKYADGVLSVYSEAACTTKLADIELDDVAENNVLGENEIYAVKFTNISEIADNGKTAFAFDNLWYKSNADKLSDFKISFYATQDMLDNGVQFTLSFAIESADAVSFVIKPGTSSEKSDDQLTYIKGLNYYELTATDVDFSKVVSIDLVYEGGDNNAKDVSDFDIYFTEMGFTLSDVNVEVEGPASNNAKCKHVDAFDEDAFKPVDEMVVGNCAYGSHYLLKCTECGATKIDTSRPLGYIDTHTYDDKVHTDYATCFKNGRNYRVCTVCGYEETTEVLVSEGHQYVIVSIVGKNVTRLCKNCGIDSSFIIRDELMTFEEKMNELGFSDDEKNNWSAEQTRNQNIKVKAEYGTAGWINTYCKGYAGTEPVWETVDTDYGSMLRMNCIGSNETYFTFYGKTITATSFVIEFDYMLGEPGVGGKYMTTQLSLTPISKTGKKESYGHLRLQSDGSVQLSGYVPQENRTDFADHAKYQFEKNRIYNIACHYNLATNKLILYINGVKWDDCQFLADVSDSTAFSLSYYRFGCYGDKPVGSQQYFNNFLLYEAENEPLGVITSGLIDDSGFEGDVVLEDELFNEMHPAFNVADDGHSVKVNVPAALNLDKYVFEFGINAETLNDGTLLVATKRGVGYDRNVDLVTVNDGKIYVGGILVSEKLNVKLSFVFDDNLNSLIVYVDGQRIAGTIYFEGNFADSMASIRSFTFNNIDNYGVSGLEMYTGTEIK